MTMFMIDN